MNAVRAELHRLIDESPDDEFLNVIHSVFEEKTRESTVWEKLSDDQKQHVLDSEKQIENKAALISNEEMIERNLKWLK